MHRVRFYVGTVRAEVTDWIPGKGTGERASTPGERDDARVGLGIARVTERQWDKVESRLNEAWQGFTRFEAVGSWQGEQEPTRVYEVLIPDVHLSNHRLNEMARSIGHDAGQAAVYYTREEVMGGLVWSRVKGESAIEESEEQRTYRLEGRRP